MPVTKLVMPGPFCAMHTPCLPGNARIAVGHVRGVLLVGDGNEADAGERKQIVRIHVGGADDAEAVLHALRHQGFDERFAGRHAKFAARHEFFVSAIVFIRSPLNSG